MVANKYAIRGITDSRRRVNVVFSTPTPTSNQPNAPRIVCLGNSATRFGSNKRPISTIHGTAEREKNASTRAPPTGADSEISFRTEVSLCSEVDSPPFVPDVLRFETCGDQRGCGLYRTSGVRCKSAAIICSFAKDRELLGFVLSQSSPYFRCCVVALSEVCRKCGSLRVLPISPRMLCLPREPTGGSETLNRFS